MRTILTMSLAAMLTMFAAGCSHEHHHHDHAYRPHHRTAPDFGRHDDCDW